MEIKKIYKIIIALAICFFAEAAGSLFAGNAVITWYPGLEKPGFNPPNWIFGPVWTLLFALMGISLFLIWEKGNQRRKTALKLFSIQLILNILWSFLFFFLQAPLYAFIEIIILWITILISIIYFYKISKLAAGLFVPYLLWITFAAVLNYFIYILN